MVNSLYGVAQFLNAVTRATINKGSFVLIVIQLTAEFFKRFIQYLANDARCKKLPVRLKVTGPWKFRRVANTFREL